jgi:hypothetical protein
MDYKYPPVYKYIILLILITTFLRYYKVLTKENFLLIAGIFTYMTFVFDYVLIENHPGLFYDGQASESMQPRKVIYVKKGKHKKPLKNRKHKIRLVRNSDEDPMIEDFENEEEDKQTLEEKFSKEIKELEKKSQDTDSDNLTEEIQKELDELDLE